MTSHSPGRAPFPRPPPGRPGPRPPGRVHPSPPAKIVTSCPSDSGYPPATVSAYVPAPPIAPNSSVPSTIRMGPARYEHVRAACRPGPAWRDAAVRAAATSRPGRALSRDGCRQRRALGGDDARRPLVVPRRFSSATRGTGDEVRLARRDLAGRGIEFTDDPVGALDRVRAVVKSPGVSLSHPESRPPGRARLPILDEFGFGWRLPHGSPSSQSPGRMGSRRPAPLVVAALARRGHEAAPRRQRRGIPAPLPR